jgi:hypothetical protein
MTGSESHPTLSPSRTLLGPINVALTIRASGKSVLFIGSISFSKSLARPLPDASSWFLI